MLTLHISTSDTPSHPHPVGIRLVVFCAEDGRDGVDGILVAIEGVSSFIGCTSN